MGVYTGLDGLPILRGPYIVDYSDFGPAPMEAHTVTLWTPQVGDVLLRLFPNWRTVVQWDHGNLAIGQNVGHSTEIGYFNVIDFGGTGDIAGQNQYGGVLDSVVDAPGGQVYDSSGNYWSVSAHVFPTADPVQIGLFQTGGTDPTQGHVELYALVARALAP